MLWESELLCKFMIDKLKLMLPIIIVAVFGIIAGFSLLHKGLPPTHDGEYHIVRFFLFNEALKDGNLYPRWAGHLNNGFGVPLFNFVYPLPNYIASILHLFSFSFIDSFKAQMFAAVIIGGIFFYLWSKEFWGKLGGVVSSIFYTFSPYHFVDIYIRGSVGEVWALTFFPAFLWAYTKFVATRRRRFSLFSSLFLALIIFSHNILALMFFIFSLSYITLLICKEENKAYLIFNTFYIMLLGLGLSAIFWLPAIYETKYVTGLEIFDLSVHFPDLYQLLIPSWGSGFSGEELRNTLSFQIGLANLLAIFLSLIVIFWQVVKRNRKYIYTLFFFIWFVFTFYSMLKISLPIWKTVPFMNYFQFPWRLLSLEILFASFLAGSIFSVITKRRLVKQALAIFLVFVTFMLGIGYAKPAYYMHREDNYYLTRPNFMDGTNSPGNLFNTIWFNPNLKRQKNKITFKNSLGQVRTESLSSTRYVFNVILNKETEVTINTAYFPGWEVFVDGKKIKISHNKDGLITFSILEGKHSILVTFGETDIGKLAKIVTSISLLWLISR